MNIEALAEEKQVNCNWPDDTQLYHSVDSKCIGGGSTLKLTKMDA
jgi:hypothetical protein